MKYVANKTFLHDQLGRVEKGQEFQANSAQLSGISHFVTAVKPQSGDAEKAKKPAKKSD